MSDPLYPPRGSTTQEGQAVLCPELYRKLNKEFIGEVKVANEGQPMDMHYYTTADGRKHTVINDAGEYYRVCCPFCGDTRHRLWVNHYFGQRDAEGRPMYFLAYCYNEQCMENYMYRKKLIVALFGFKNAPYRRTAAFPVHVPDWDTVALRKAEMPGEVIPLSQLAVSMPSHPAVAYMVGRRGYSSAMLDHYEIGFCNRAKEHFRASQGRIIFPVKFEGKLVGWQGRITEPNPATKRIAKYYTMPGMKKSQVLYNYDNAKDKPFVVVTEGVTDVHTVGDHAVALLGKKASNVQRELLINTWAGKPVILILDPDAAVETKGVTDQLIQSGVPVVVVKLPEGYDCGDYDQNTLFNIMYAKASECGIKLPGACVTA